MRFRRRKRKPFLNVLLDSGVDLLTSMRERMPDVGNLRDTVTNTYETASDRVGRAAGALRGEEESLVFRTVATLLIGVGIGVGIGLLIAPATGEETRADLAEVASDVRDKFRPEATGKKAANAATKLDRV
jgi:hypothetical protein